MRALPHIVFAAAKFDDGDLLRFAVTNHCGRDLATAQERGADLDVRTFTHEQNLAELDGGARLGIELFDAKRAVLGHSILFAAGGDNRIHAGILRERGRGAKKAAHSTDRPAPGQTQLSPNETTV